jgi:glycosyltransferase involved in cell wall biosynthesis
MTIAFIHPHKAFLPEIDAYGNFFCNYNIETIVLRPDEAKNSVAEIEWHLLGTDTSKKKNVIKIHEYASSSKPPLHTKKDRLKRIFMTIPDYRLFLNEYVRKQFNFKDGVPFGYRNMGIDPLLLDRFDEGTKEFDFIYTGSVEKERQIESLIGCFTKEPLKRHTLLILSQNYERLKKEFTPFQNIHFEGPVKQDEVKNYILRSRFALNFIIDKEPFNQQVSTKFLEYAALKIPILTSSYPWIRSFQQQYGGSYYYLNKDLSNLSWPEISNYHYVFPQLADWTWENQIRKSGILEFLHSKFPILEF